MEINSECGYCEAQNTNIVCNMCGKTFDMWDRQAKFGIHTRVEYGSTFDCNNIDLDLCCGCFDKVFAGLIPLCKINPLKEVIE